MELSGSGMRVGCSGQGKESGGPKEESWEREMKERGVVDALWMDASEVFLREEVF